MKILISSHAFAPDIGGIETVSGLLAEEFSKLGAEVVVVTQSRGDANFPFRVVRRPSPGALIRLVNWCEVFWQNNLSLRTVWPALFLRRKIVVTHQGSYCRSPSGIDLAQRVKLALANRLPSVAISHAVAQCFCTNSTIIPNPYDSRTFEVRSTSSVRSGLAFVGRLVSEKGVDLLLESLARLVSLGLRPRLTIVGSGPEERSLRELCDKLSSRDQVTFVGAKKPFEIAEILNQHQILVVPSRYAEPFGVVALEGIASGCVVVGSNGGGLPEAIGPCGVTFENGDVGGLTSELARLLNNPSECDRLIANAPQHLKRFQLPAIAKSYLDIFR
jgi:glycogen synthase